ncbi:hypothetical protein Gotur_023916 [Gossypium turneri]
MEIEEFPSHIIEKIKNTWETWNSPPRLSSDSLHLDEIEEMNLTNIQEDEDKKSCIRKIIIKSMIMQAVTKAAMTQAVMEVVIKCKHDTWNQPEPCKRHETWKQPHP